MTAVSSFSELLFYLSEYTLNLQIRLSLNKHRKLRELDASMIMHRLRSCLFAHRPMVESIWH